MKVVISPFLPATASGEGGQSFVILVLIKSP